MRKFYTLLSREVRSYFYSPIAYIVLVFFLFVAGADFYFQLSFMNQRPVNYSVQEAVEEALKKDTYDELIISTLPDPEAHTTFEQYQTRIRRFSQIPMRHLLNAEGQEIKRA